MNRTVNAGTRTLLFIALALLLIFSTRRLVFDVESPPTVDFTGQTMGTTYSVKVAHVKMSDERRAQIGSLIDDRLDEVNSLMSTYDATSEVEQFNRYQVGAPFHASVHLIHVLHVASRVSDETGGAFDVTARPLVDVWGFGPEPGPESPPGADALELLRQRVGYHYLNIDTVSNTVTKTKPDVVVDLSAVAKGYGVDRVVDALATEDLCCFLVEIGGELRARGTRTDGLPWRVGIESPSLTHQSVLAILELRDEAVATSGDYRNFVEWDGRRYTHIIDPRTAFPVPFTSSSVTVVHGSTTIADAWATALSVLGVAEGRAIAERVGISAHFAWQTDDEVRSVATSAFEARRDVGARP